MGNEWRIIQRRGQLRIYLKDERNFSSMIIFTFALINNMVKE